MNVNVGCDAAKAYHKWNYTHDVYSLARYQSRLKSVYELESYCVISLRHHFKRFYSLYLQLVTYYIYSSIG